METKLRNEIEEKYKWDLSKLAQICENDDIFNSINKYIDKLLKLKGKIKDTSDNLYNALELNVEIERNLINLYVYAYQKFYEDTSDNKRQEYKNKIYKFYNEAAEKISFFEPEILDIDYELIKKYVKENDKLSKYKFYLEKMFRFKEHVLSEAEEKILTSLSPILTSSKEVFSSITDTDFVFDKIKDENGNLSDLTNESYIRYISSNDRNVRKNAFSAFYKEYAKFKNSIAQLYITNIKKDVIISRLRGHNSALEQGLFPDDVNKEVYLNLINIVNKNLDKFHKFFELKRRSLNLDELHMYDIYASSNSTFTKEYTYDEAKETVISALSILGDDYKNILLKAFDEKWMDVMPNKAKRSGAYSWGTYDSKPYLMLNFDGTIKNVGTLAHELGHSIHSYLSNTTQDYIYHDYPIILAEIASTVNEVLLADYMLKNTNSKEEKEYILNDLLDLFRGTLLRQTMFAEFEYLAHKKEENNESLTEKDLSDLYYDLNKKYYGENVISDDEIRYEWERIPHFYTSFYVYKYATGLSVACAIANDIINKKDGALDNYIKFLSSGSSDYPLNLLKECGYDLTKKEVIQNALDMFNKYLNELDKLINEK